MNDNKLIVGRINGVYGIKGWVKVFSYTDPVGNILSYQPWWIKRDGHWQAVNVLASQTPQGGKAIVAQLEGVNSRDEARALMGCDIALQRTQLPEDPTGYYWADLVGCQVYDQHDALLGEITELVETGAHDVMRIKGEKSFLIPFVFDAYVQNVDLEVRKITVYWDQAEDES